MSAAIILAKDYGEAATVAARLGLGQDWVYPHSVEIVLGRVIERVVYVEGWERSATLSADAVALLPDRMTTAATEEYVSRGELFAAIIGSPFVEAVTPDARTVGPQHAGARRRPLSRLAGALIGAAIGVVAASGILALLGWPW